MTNAPRTIPGATAHIAVPAALTAPPPPGPTPLREPGNAAIGAPKPGTERLGLAANGGRAGAMGVHPSQLASFGHQDTIESVLATTVRMAQPHVMLARLSGLVAKVRENRQRPGA